MGFLPQCNSTLENETIAEVPVWHDYTFHRIGLWLSAVFGLIAIAVSFFLIFMHATHYLRPWEQKHIIRILFMVPIYAAVSFLSYYNYKNAIYFEVIRDCYEAFAIASFFSLLCHYLAPNLHEQKEYFRAIRPRPWIWPIPWLQQCCGGEQGMWRTPRSGLTWFNVIWTGIFQYCFIRVAMTLTACITQIFGRYCLESLSPAFAHVWVTVIEAVAVTVAMFCIIQFYLQIRQDVAEYKPLLKVAAIKLVIFLSFWQTIILSFLTSLNAIKASDKFQTPDIKVGIPAMLLCIEMAIFSVFHIFAFSWKPYALQSKERLAEIVPGEDSSPAAYKGGPLGIKALMEAFNPWDVVKQVGRAGKWVVHGRRHRLEDPSYDITRQNTGDNSFNGIKPSTTPFTLASDTETAYTSGPPIRPSSNSKPIRYFNDGSTVAAPEHQNLLANAQAMAQSRPSDSGNGMTVPYRMDTSPYRGDRREASPYTPRESEDVYRSTYAPPPPQAANIGVAHSTYDEQQSGVTAAPYPDRDQHGSFGTGRIDMPYAPQSSRRDDRGNGNGGFI